MLSGPPNPQTPGDAQGGMAPIKWAEGAATLRPSLRSGP